MHPSQHTPRTASCKPHAPFRRRLLRRFGLIVSLLAALTVQPVLLRGPAAHAAVESAGSGGPAAQAAVESAVSDCDSDLARYAVSRINLWRRTIKPDLPSLIWNHKVDSVACAHSDLLLTTSPANGCPDPHQCPGEPDSVARLRNAGIAFNWSGENVGHGWSTRELDDRMMRKLIRDIHRQFVAEGPGGPHYENIVSEHFQRVGVGVVYDDHHIWFTEDFIGE
jgi:uncharacterized protein YkwD